MLQMGGGRGEGSCGDGILAGEITRYDSKVMNEHGEVGKG